MQATQCSPYGTPHPDQATCESAGCCFHTGGQAAFSCFNNHTVDEWLCAVPSAAKTSCDRRVATNATTCVAAGCCWGGNGTCYERRQDLSVKLSYSGAQHGSPTTTVKSDVREYHT